jgi:hypothetical protein
MRTHDESSHERESTPLNWELVDHYRYAGPYKGMRGLSHSLQFPLKLHD